MPICQKWYLMVEPQTKRARLPLPISSEVVPDGGASNEAGPAPAYPFRQKWVRDDGAYKKRTVPALISYNIRHSPDVGMVRDEGRIISRPVSP
jgi:hypothetical protein